MFHLALLWLDILSPDDVSQIFCLFNPQLAFLFGLAVNPALRRAPLTASYRSRREAQSMDDDVIQLGSGVLLLGSQDYIHHPLGCRGRSVYSKGQDLVVV
jgi:hypothetical protein